VAVDPARYWRTIGCPVCKAPMDALRTRRAMAWLTGRAPRSGVRFSGRFRVIPLEILVGLWGVLIAALTVTLHTVADAWWPATILLFLGR